MPLRGDSDSVVLGQEWELGGYFNKLLRPLGSKVWSASIHLKPASDWSSLPPKTALLILHLNMVPSRFHCLNLPIVPFKCRGGGWGVQGATFRTTHKAKALCSVLTVRDTLILLPRPCLPQGLPSHRSIQSRLHIPVCVHVWQLQSHVGIDHWLPGTRPKVSYSDISDKA